MKEIQVFRLDDDNHSPCYASRDTYWYDDEFVAMLCEPHEEKYIIRDLPLINLKEDLTFEGKNVDRLFNILDDFCYRYNRKHAKTEEDFALRAKVFDFFWNTPSDEIFD